MDKDEDLYRVVWKSRATNASGRGKPLTRAAADYEMAWMKKAWSDHDHWLEIVGDADAGQYWQTPQEGLNN